MNKRLFLFLLSSAFISANSVVNVSPAFASSDDEDDEQDDHDEDEEDDHDDDDHEDERDDHDDDDHDDDHDDHDGDHQQALNAVQAHEAISLREMLAIYQREIGEKIIDISLFQRRGQLVYRFRYVDGTGHVLFAFFQASTGDLLGN